MITFLLLGVAVTCADSWAEAVTHTSRDSGRGGWEHLENNVFLVRMMGVHIVST